MGLLNYLLGTKAELLFTSGRCVFKMKASTITIGRNDKLHFDTIHQIAALVSPSHIDIVGDFTSNRQVSHKHVKLTWDTKLKRYSIEDLASKYGTKVNQASIIPGKKVVLQHQDKIELGKSIEFQILYNN